ncbi:hypothetical protein NVP1084O_227 [Vibrio phage 1.084.O._10N.261.49.F5]|nr:hypothetical protein NVP1084O_227 [Vibrio phage 1.084.O._10N.261.49.F5]
MKSVKTITSYAGTSITSRKIAREVVATLKVSKQVAKVVDNGIDSLNRWAVSIECDITPRQTLTVSRKPSKHVFASMKCENLTQRRTARNKTIVSPFAVVQNVQTKSVQVYTKKSRVISAQ